MIFTSDNAYGAAPVILESLARANTGALPSYGGDEITAKLGERMNAVFERHVAVFPVVSGTAANALALATLVPPHGAVLCHADAHIAADECGAVEFFSHGARLVTIEGADGKLTADAIARALERFRAGFVHHSQPSAISLTQASECGTCYRMEEITAISALARKHGLKLHMDGARFANAVACFGCSPAEATWRIGVDALSFGATKNGALCAEAVVFFDPEAVRDFEYRRKKSGHLVSKMRFLSAQLLSYLEQDRWLALARRANALAARLGAGLETIEGVELAHPVEANAVFAYVPDEMAARLRAAGALFYDWSPPAAGRTLVRLVCAHATPEADIARFIETARDASGCAKKEAG
jgi:threonine aldolase